MVKSDREILESLTMDDLQEQHREIAEAVGLEGMLNLTNAFGAIRFIFLKSGNL